MVVVEIGGRLDPASRALLAATCGQFRDWMSPLPKLTARDIIAQGHLRWAERTLSRLYWATDACYGVVQYAANPHHSSLSSVFNIFTIPPFSHRFGGSFKNGATGKILTALIRAERDDLLREWSTSGIEIPGLSNGSTRQFFLRDDYLTVFARHDILPQVTKSIYDLDGILWLFGNSPANYDVTLLGRIVVLARNDEKFRRVVSSLLEQTPLFGTLWFDVLSWHLRAVVGLPRICGGSRSGNEKLQYLFKHRNVLLKWINWLEPGIFDPLTICRGFTKYKDHGSRFMKDWRVFDAKGLIEGNRFTVRHCSKILSKRSDEEIRFLRDWATARGLQGWISLIDAFFQF